MKFATVLAAAAFALVGASAASAQNSFTAVQEAGRDAKINLTQKSNKTNEAFTDQTAGRDAKLNLKQVSKRGNVAEAFQSAGRDAKIKAKQIDLGRRGRP